ncbi:MAG: trigger factor [Alphaproteobacteria bacterium]|nr:trigger factor [Alphaproteobacteria bacterium]
MNVVETKSEGLSREYKVSVPAADLAAKLSAKIDEIRPKVQLKGFRPGKVPTSHIRKLYGKSLMGEILESTLQETSQQALSEQSLRPAAQPTIHLDAPADKVVSGEADLEFHMQVEVMPDFEPADVAELAVERMVVTATDEEVQEALGRIAASNKTYDVREDGAPAETGDAVVVDFAGKIDDEPFDGGSAEGQTIVLGDGRFIAGFEDQLIGARAGDDVEVNVTFPDAYPVDALKGKAAVFAVKVKEVKAPRTPGIDEEFAKGLGFDDLEGLTAAMKGQLDGELGQASRQQVKRSLLDALDGKHAFDLPPMMVKAEFEQIWSQLEEERKADRLSEEDKGKTDDELKAEYRAIAERRVRLGLVLAEIGRRAKIDITNEEVVGALRQEAARYPGQEKEVIDFYRKNPGALAQLRAPIYEEKVVDYILAHAQVTEKPVTREELMKEVGDE